MPYAIEVLPALSAICVTFTETVTLPERARALEEILRHHHESEARNLLVDLTQATVIDASNAETVDYAARLARQPAIRSMRIAYVGDPVRSSSIESLAALRGYFYRRFSTRRAALRWMA
jgi:hypothetical protein